MKFNLRTKLIGSFVIILILMVIVGLMGTYTSKTIRDRLDNIIEQDIKPANILGDVARRVGLVRANSLLHLLTRSIDEMNRYESETNDWIGKVNTDLDTIKNTFEDQATLDKLAEFRTAWETYLRTWREQVVPLSRANRDEEAVTLARKGGIAGMAAREAMYKLDELHDVNVAAANHRLELADQASRKSQYILSVVILLAIILGLAFGIRQSSLIAGPVNAVSKAAQLVAAGDLDQKVEVKTGDEIEYMANSFNTMTVKLKAMVEELQHEITERRRAEDRLRESKQWLSTTLRSIGDAVIATDAEGLVTLMNPVAEDLTGWDEPETAGKPLEDIFNIINDQTGGRAENPVARVLQEGVVVGLADHTVLIAKDGTKRHIADSGAPIRDEEGEIIGTVMVFRDITERKQAEEELRKHRDHLEELVQDRTEALRESEEKYREVVETSVDGVISVDSQMKVGVWNKGAERIFGYTEEEMTGQSLMKIVSERYKKEMEKGFVEFRKSGLGPVIGKTLELQGVRKDGTEIPVEVSVSSRKKNETHIATAIVRDITERKKAEEEKKKLEAQFLQSQKMEAIGTLAGGVAHDFNNLLTTIIGNAELSLVGLGKDNSLRENIEEVKKAANSAASLTRQLLAFSRKQVLQPVILNLNTVAMNLEKMLKRLIGEDVEMSTVLEPELWKVHADPGQIEQVIMNLAVNAKDAMPRGGKLTIETANVELDENYFRDHGVKNPPGPYVMLAVSDTGKGMDKETQSRIFEPFFTTKEVGKGTGLGLSTVYGIIKQSNGFIWIYSEPGGGTTFKVYLPRVEKEGESVKKEIIPMGSLRGSETVLIVEDNDALRNLACKILQPQGYSILVAQSGEEALRVSEGHKGPIDLMITDVVMPGMSGPKLAEALLPLRPEMKVLYMSGHTNNTIVHHGMLDSDLSFLEKPFSPEGLARKVREVLD